MTVTNHNKILCVIILLPFSLESCVILSPVQAPTH